MKKVLLICLALILTLFGCSQMQPSYSEPLVFYYPVNNIDFSMGSAYIQPEVREGDGVGDSLQETLDLYLKGPMDPSTYYTPFQHNTRVESISRDSQLLDITLSRGFATYTGLPLTIACACITMTCLELTDVQAVRIRAKDTTLDGADYIEMSADSLLLIDYGKEIQE